MAVIEVQTIEGGRIDWVAIYSDTDPERAVEWVDRLLMNAREPKPHFRILDKRFGKVIGAWQEEGYEGDNRYV